MTTSQRHRTGMLFASGLWLGSAGAAFGQEGEEKAREGTRWFVRTEPFAPLIADPLETQIRGAIVSAKLESFMVASI